VVLLVSAGLFLRSAANARTIDPGFDTRNVLNASLNLGLGQYDEPRGRQFYRDVIDRLEALPSVQTAAFAQTVPFGRVNRSMTEISVDGYEPGPDERMFSFYNVVGPRYFETLDIPIVRGRGFDGRDREDAAAVAVVNETMARRFWPQKEPIGQTFRFGGTLQKVIGVAGDGKYATLGEKPRSYFYLPLFQNYGELVSLHVRTVGDPAGVAPAVLRQIELLDSDLPVWAVKTMNEHLGVALFVPNTTGAVIGVFGLLALVLAVTGIFGVVAYTVSQGTRELGIRMALGARESEILKLVLSKGFKTALYGIGIGLVLASAVTHIFSGFLYGVHPLDTLTFVGVSALLFFATLVACYVPARKAAGVDPNLVLRYE
jgi:predicted permease